MKIIIGLGNPGEKYENTWHNIGFMVIDEFARENNFPDFSFAKKFNALTSEKNINNEKIILAKPETYMNESGKTAKQLSDFYKFGTSEMIIIHDDVDVAAGKIKISFDRGSAGHKGVQSIFNETGKENFIRIRIGISPQSGKEKKAMETVLKKISRNEKSSAKKAIEKACEAINTVISEGLEKTMSQYNKQ